MTEKTWAMADSHPCMRFDRECQACSLGRGDAVGGAGPLDLNQVRLIVVSDHPGYYERKYGYPFVSNLEVGKKKATGIPQSRNAGAFLRKAIEEYLGLDSYNQCWLTNAAKCDRGKEGDIQEGMHLRPCSRWLRPEIDVLDRYCPRAPILIAGAKALKAMKFVFKDQRPIIDRGLKANRRRRGVTLGTHPAFFTYNPASVARSEPKLETKVGKKRIQQAQWLYPPLPRTPTWTFFKDLEPLKEYLDRE